MSAPRKRGKKADMRIWSKAGPEIIGGAKCCPNAIISYRFKNPHDPLVVDIRKHLSYLGWKIEYTKSKGMGALLFRYTSPAGKRYNSLVQLCQDMRKSTTMDMHTDMEIMRKSTMDMDMEIMTKSTTTDMEMEVHPPSTTSHSHIEPQIGPDAVHWWYLRGIDKERCHELDIKASALTLKVRNYLLFLGWNIWYGEKGTKRELRYTSPSGATYYSLKAACKGCIDEGQIPDCLASSEKIYSNNIAKQEISTPLNSMEPAIGSSSMPQSKKRKRKDDSKVNEYTPVTKSSSKPPSEKRGRKAKSSETLKKLGDDIKGDQPTGELGSIETTGPKVLHRSKPDRLPHIKLKWLMDNNAVFPEDKVHYRDRKGGPPLAAGRITRHGIKCNCCHKVFTLTSFEAHAGSKNHRPAANIILENGKSLLDCQIQLAGDSKARSKKTKKHHGMKNELVEEDNDFICTVCHCDGELILCDQCPSSFHKSCLGLKDVPDGKWFCHSCCCAICLQRAVKESTEDSTNNSVHTCYQCERKYHAGCLRSRDVPMSESSVEGKWFCGSNCEKIYSGLHELLGRPIQVGVNDLTWTLVKCTDQRQYYSKLNAALEVMHECFMPCKEAGRDLVEDVIFSRPSELNRLNFKGFYTILLERRKKLISAATVRIYGKEVAEMPLIGTRVKYRGGGMCRTLMNELEKKLKELEVERLVLPAAHSVLKAWTTRFGFSQMTDSERVQFLKYTFLNFHGTIMCQKVLEKSHSTDSSLLGENSSTVIEQVSGSSFDWSHEISEILEAEHIEESGVVNQCLIQNS